MKKILLFLASILIISISFGKELTVIKENGRLNKDGSVTYRKIKQIFDGDGKLTYQHCLQRGHESCPRLGIITIGDESIPIDKYIILAEDVIVQNLKKGKTTGEISYLKGKIKIYYKNASYVLRKCRKEKETGNINYHMTIKY